MTLNCVREGQTPGEVTKLTIGGLLSLIVIILLSFPPHADGALKQFTPRIYSTVGEIEVDALYESQEYKSDGRKRSITDTYFSERVVLTSTGWVYHPRFLIFLAKIGAGLAHEKVTSDYAFSDSGGMHTSTLPEYEFRGFLLPEHPYNLEVYTLRHDRYLRGKLRPGFDTEDTASGAIFKFEQRPYIFRLSYDYSTIESEDFDEDTETLSANAVYFKDWGNIAGAYSHSDTDSSYRGFPGRTSSDQYSLENQLRFFRNRVYLDSNISYIRFDQEYYFETMDNTRFTIDERLNADLPYQFHLDVYFTRFDETTEMQYRSQGGKTELDSVTNNGGLILQHKLYESLVTVYSGNYLSLESTTGDLEGPFHSLSTSYTKKIPRGLLIAGLNFSKSEIERTGAATVISESFLAPIFGEYTLKMSDVDISSIKMWVKSAFTGNLVPLTRDVHYFVLIAGNTVRIQIISIPPDALSPDLSFEYEFRVSYRLISDDATIETTVYGGSLRLELFDHFFNPYFSYTRSKQDIDSRRSNEIPEDITTTTYGVLFQKDPYSLLLEYQDVDARLNPYKTFRAEATYNNSIAVNTSLAAQVYYRETEYGEGAFQYNEFSERVFGGYGRLERWYPKRNIHLTAGVTYVQASGNAERKAYTFDGTVYWKLKKFELRAGISIGHSEVEYQFRDQSSLYQNYYIMVKRTIF